MNTPSNEDMLNKTLDAIIENTPKSDVRIIASRMRNDREFMIAALSLFSDLCCEHPFLIQSMNEMFLAKILLKAITSKDEND